MEHVNTKPACAGPPSVFAEALPAFPDEPVCCAAGLPNICYAVIHCLHKRKAALRLAVSCQRPLIIFCGTCYKAEDMAREIAALLGPAAVRFYHAGMEGEELRQAEAFFSASADGILCAASAYGMERVRQDVRTVIHLESPLTVESYVREAGCAGRDGKRSDAILLWSPADRRKFASFAAAGREHWMLRYAESVSCRRQLLRKVLGSEAAVCSSCDACDRGGGPAPAAYDGKRALDFIRKHRKLYDWDSLSAELIRQFNRADLPLFGLNVWEHSDIACIMNALHEEGLIRRCSFPWRGRSKGRVTDTRGRSRGHPRSGPEDGPRDGPRVVTDCKGV